MLVWEKLIKEHGFNLKHTYGSGLNLDVLIEYKWRPMKFTEKKGCQELRPEEMYPPMPVPFSK